MKPRNFLFPIITLLAITIAGAEDLQCYRCSPVTEACEDNKADIVKCGNVMTSRCSRQVKKDSGEMGKALRKCVIPDNSGHVNCPVGYECFNCDKSLCNANPVIGTTPAPSSAAALKPILATVVVIFAFIYL